ncbi:DJ-1/PfpI family protein [Candidatus Phytoplasma pini]|uniref:4-methyl-5(B-hydroxyethyl)-thiazole monophosphate biosynthesis enzyme n=1 Tax=Candidatus Phytoplasma pini TaxID=267362 RepID=A0A559KJK3_9MOLU|nr:DJ-1/PfpI family protein [Candidatus Phytoplasma pini]TVY12311.1 4-methyl-5(B-hydroxyethyl)-thiazole monophosphate biosynthesis enzyme [Candidatus Phytoplasma pini]
MKGLLFLYNGFEDCEAIVTRAMLKKFGFDVITFTPNFSLKVFSSSRLELKADFLIDKMNLDEYDFLIIPGGPYVKQMLEKSDLDLKKILNIIQYFSDKKKIVGAICAAPSFLGKLNLLKKHSFVCYPGYENYIEGNYCPEKKTVTSDLFITSRSPLTVFDFVFHILNKLSKYSK